MLSKVDLFNAKNASEKLEKGLVINVVDMGQYDDKDKDGNAVKVTVFKDTENKVYTTISGIIADSFDDLNELVEESKDPVKIEVRTGKSLSGREYLYVAIVK